MSNSTTSGASGSIPAGWYPDPAGSDSKRWWDGSQWTAHLQQPEAPPPPLATFGNFVPPELRPAIAIPTADAGIAYTRTSWWLALSPAWIAASEAFVVETIMCFTSAHLHTFIPGLLALNVVVWLILYWFARLDRARLFNGGNNTFASPNWVFLTPLVYLIMRAKQVQLYALGGWASVIWFCIATVFAPGLALLAFFGAYGIFAN